MVIVDTPVWSELYRRNSSVVGVLEVMQQLVSRDEARMIGPVRQETLSGIRELGQFERLRRLLLAFPDVSIGTVDYEVAAEMCNRCRAKGIQGSNTDFLICAVSKRTLSRIYTLDQDFILYAKILPIRLFQP